MRRPDQVKTPGRGSGAGVGEAAIQGEPDEKKFATHGAAEIADRCARSLRLQAIGQIGGA